MNPKLLLLVLWACFSIPLLARADGTTDINIDPATGVTISTPGSYRLIADVTMTAAVIPINITAANVTLDLGGHTITSFGSPASVISGNQTGVQVRNGNLASMSATSGILLSGSDCVVEDVSIQAVSASGSRFGISLSGTGGRVSRAKVRGVISNDNNAVGISVSSGGLVEDCQVKTIRSGAAATSVGIETADGCVVQGNTVSGIGSTPCLSASGISAATQSLIEANTVTDVGTGATGTANGISGVGTGLYIVRNCTVVTVGANGNESNGISLSSVAAQAIGNSVSGIQVGTSGTAIGIRATNTNPIIADNTVTEVITNGGTAGAGGIVVTGYGASVTGNTISAVTSVGSGTVRGIVTDIGASIERNTLRVIISTTGTLTGISADTHSGIRANILSLLISSGAQVIGIAGSNNSIVESNTCADGNGTTISGINAGNGGAVRNNTVRNFDGSTGSATGITVTSRVIIEGNTVTDCDESSSGTGISTGISTSSNCRIVNNVCSNNLALTTGDAFGISATSNCVIEGNLCENNDAAGTGTSAGIRVSGSGNRVIGNNCVDHTGGSGTNGNTGIFIDAADNFIARNTTRGNTTRGITINIAGNRTQENMSADAAISGGSGLAGDLADVVY